MNTWPDGSHQAFGPDLTVFEADPLRVPAIELPDVNIALTVVDGVVRHRGARQ